MSVIDESCRMFRVCENPLPAAVVVSAAAAAPVEGCGTDAMTAGSCSSVEAVGIARCRAMAIVSTVVDDDDVPVVAGGQQGGWQAGAEVSRGNAGAEKHTNKIRSMSYP